MRRSRKKSYKFRNFPLETKLEYLRRSDISERAYINLVYESTFDYSYPLHQAIVKNPIFKKLAEKVNRVLSVDTAFGRKPIMYSIGNIYIRKQTMDDLQKEEVSSIYVQAVQMRYFAKFAKMLFDISLEPLLNFVKDLINLQEEPFFKLILDKDLSLLFFSNKTVDINKLKTSIVYTKQYPLEVSLYYDEVHIVSKNQKLFKQTVKRISSSTIRDIQLQIALA